MREARVELPYVPSWRDRIAWRLATAALLVATPTYRALLRGAYVGGLRAAIRDTERGDGS